MMRRIGKSSDRNNILSTGYCVVYLFVTYLNGNMHVPVFSVAAAGILAFNLKLARNFRFINAALAKPGRSNITPILNRFIRNIFV